MKRHRDFSRFNPLATVRIKWGVVGDGIAVSWVKKRRDRPRENERPTTDPLAIPPRIRSRARREEGRQIFLRRLVRFSEREEGFLSFFFQRSRYRLKLDRYRSDDLGDELFAQRNKDLDGRKRGHVCREKAVARSVTM